ncbi:MAG: TonB-dependent receptor [Prevotella sp.]|nr:TonB-dependent receptor [Prevotella sp.]
MKKTTIILAVCLASTAVSAQNVTDSDSLQTQRMEEVVVTHQRQLVKNDIDKLTYDVQHDEAAKSKNTLEMLRKVPMVTVDGQENIKVQGSSNFRIYKNGHPDPSLSGQNVKDVLKAIPATNIKKIEVITDPGAKYDAEGTSAILNIVMMDNSHMQGVAGNVNMHSNTYGSANLGTYLTTQVGKLTTALSYNYVKQNRRQAENDSEAAYDYVKTGERSLATLHGYTAADIHLGDISASYEIDSLNLLSASFNAFYYKLDARGQGTHARWDANDHLLYQYDSQSSYPGYSHYDLGGRMDYERKTHLQGEVLTLSYMLAATRHHNVQRQEYTNMVNMPVGYTGYDQDSRERFTEHTFQVDYVRPLGNHHKIETGLKYILRTNNSNTLMDYQGAEKDVDTQFRHSTQVGAAYLSYILTAGKWSARAGLRYERSYMKARYPDGTHDGFHSTLNDWVPSASVQYKISDAQSLKLSYGTSINRPGISYLNPAVISTPTTVNFGKSTLGSSRNQRLQLTYMLTTPKLTLNFSPYYAFTNNGITDINYEENRRHVSTYDNVLKRKELGISTYTQCQPFTGTTLSLNASLRCAHITIPAPALRNTGWGGYISLDMEQKLPWKLTLGAQLDADYGRRIFSPYDIEGRWYDYNVSLTRLFLKEKLSVSLYAHMPFNSREHYNYRTIQGDYTGYNRTTDKPRVFGIRMTWNFGKLKASVKKAERTIENDDLVGGVKK